LIKPDFHRYSLWHWQCSRNRS